MATPLTTTAWAELVTSPSPVTSYCAICTPRGGDSTHSVLQTFWQLSLGAKCVVTKYVANSISAAHAYTNATKAVSSPRPPPPLHAWENLQARVTKLTWTCLPADWPAKCGHRIGVASVLHAFDTCVSTACAIAIDIHSVATTAITGGLDVLSPHSPVTPDFIAAVCPHQTHSPFLAGGHTPRHCRCCSGDASVSG